MSSINSPMQEEANRQTLLLVQAINQYQRLTDRGRSLQNIPSIHRPIPNLYIKNPDAWVVSRQTLDGDFDLDELLAKELSSRLVSNLLDGGWLKDYLNYKPDKNVRFNEKLKDAAFGAPNILGNINQSRRAGETAISSQKITAAEKMIKSGAVRSVKINNNMTLYDANKSGKGAPRLRIRVTGLQTKVITPRIDPQMLKANPHAIRSYSSGSLSIRADAMRNPGGLAGMTGKMRYLNLTGVGGALTFAPSTAIDLYRNFNDGQLDGRQFVIDQAAHQSGNAAGWAGGVIGGAIVIGFGFTGAPVLLAILIGGIAVQMIWNYFGGGDWAGRQTEKLMDSGWSDIDSQFFCP